MGKKIQCIGRYVMDGQTLGKGNFAKVELATHGVTGCKVAIKILDTRKIKEDYTRNNLHREARILGQLRHPNIVRLYETLKATTLYCLVLEYASGGDLLSFLKSQKDGRIFEDKARPFFRQMVSAIHYLHERGVAHRDLKMENILLDEKKKTVKVIDFGLSNTFSREEMLKTHCGSPEYAAPELIASNDKYGPEVDIWSLGVILYAMLVGKLPFTTHYTDQYRRQKLQAQIEKGLIGQHDKEMFGLTTDCKELLKKILEPCPELRLPLTDIELHPWVTLNNRMPFSLFHHLPKDKHTKSQEFENDSETEEVTEELSGLLQIPREQLEKTVHESRCDDLSAMFNMMLDSKRQDKGVFDIDFTLKQERKTEGRTKRRHHHKPSSSKHEHKGKEKESPIISQKKATPAILCPEGQGEHHSDTEGVVDPANKSHTSTSFDLMALCSAPTWLGPERRKSRRRRSPMPPHSPFQADQGKHEGETAAGGSATANLLSPSQASTQVSVLLRRNSSRRRPRRTSSADPPSRRSSSRRRRRAGTPGSQPNSPNSPANLNNPEIRIVTPKQSPLPVLRPSNLLGLKECYANSDDNILSTVKPKSTPIRLSRRDRERLDSNLSDSSNPCSTTNLHEGFSDGSQDTFPNPESRPESRNSLGIRDNQDQSVESKIAATDIRSIVRPKQYVLKGKTNGPLKSVIAQSNGSLHVPNTEEQDLNMSSSPEIIIESTMQSNAYANLSDDEKLEQNGGNVSCELPRTDSEKRIELEIGDIRLPVLGSSQDNADSSTECLGAASSLKGAPDFQEDEHTSDIAIANDLRDGPVGELYASSLGSAINSKECDSHGHLDGGIPDEQQHLTVDLFSKKEGVSLPDDISFVDSSDHNSSQENLFVDGKRRLKESVTSEESISAPLLISPRIAKSTQSETFLGDVNSPVKPTGGSFRSSRHGSTPSVRFVMPSTPIRQMFKMPIARIESFHSDDFEVFTSEVDALVSSPTPSPSPSSVQTPTVPCFQYKLHSRRKKNLLKAQQKGKRQNCVKDGMQFAKDGVMSLPTDNSLRVDTKPNDPLFSSGSEGGSDGQIPDGDRASNASRAKIFPMEKGSSMEEPDQSDQKGNRLTSQLNDKSKLITEISSNQNNSKKLSNSVNKTSNSKPVQEAEPTKKSGVKTVWKRGFAHLLKKKKFSNITSSGNNNNDVDSPSRNHRSSNHRTTRNGHARGPVPVSPPRTLDIPVTTVDIQWTQGSLVSNNVPGNVKSGDNVGRSSSARTPSPTKTRVYDFALVTSETSKGRPCLLSWNACRECTFSEEHSSGESSDGNMTQGDGVFAADQTSSIPISGFQDSSFNTARNIANS